MSKRDREEPCGICDHYHKYEEGEVCGECGHVLSKNVISIQQTASTSEIVPDFLYLGSYDNAFRYELLQAQNITHILNTVPACQNPHKFTFTYYSLQDDKNLAFDDAIKFLEYCEKEKARVLVHCMLGKNRSAAIVIAYLMKRRRWRFPQSYQWVKDRRPSVDLSESSYQQLKQYEVKLFAPDDKFKPSMSIFPPPGALASHK